MFEDASIGLLLLVQSYLRWEQLKGANQGFTRKLFCDDIEEYLKKSNFQEKLSSKTLATYFGNFDSGDFKRLESSTSITDALARFAAGITFLEFWNSEINVSDEEILRALTTMRINYITKPKLPGNSKIVTFAELEKLEFKTRDIEVNCITPSLQWAVHYFDHYMEYFKKTQNRFRYILTDDMDNKYYHRIEKFIADNGINNVDIKPLADYQISQNILDQNGATVELNKRRRFEKIEGITFPIPADIVLYRKVQSDDEKEFLFGVVDTTMVEEIVLSDVALKIEQYRAIDLMRWFDSVWALDKNQMLPESL